ncbi:hypothetical protein BOO86_25455 [Mycobacterium sp. CBMA 234]|uniref:universal stress protein n=1 Tax=Mycolicibacterium sp. CBMA 234 TaxID=1918495 RepID=UPI001391181E|nr:universal stress protein [Mycolicibacterium sp. CBMA 234]MUL67844.1 hypothetical protein [Mycolicibacterium sp. CBMA 234]
MYKSASPSSAVIVGIDGSQRSVDAALWGVDEAVSRDLPLRLLYVVEPRGHGATDSQQEAQDLACADASVRQAVLAVESTAKAVKVEWEVLQGHPARTLQHASRSADLLCIGSLGIAHATGHRIDSIAATLAASALCPVAVVRGNNQHYSTQPPHVVVEIDESEDNVHVLDAGIVEARLRGATLTVLTKRQTNPAGVRETLQGETATARWDKRLSRHRLNNLDIKFNPVAICGSTMKYVEHHTNSIQLLVIGRHRRRGTSEILGASRTVPRQVNCTVLICQHNQRL